MNEYTITEDIEALATTFDVDYDLMEEIDVDAETLALIEEMEAE